MISRMRQPAARALATAASLVLAAAAHAGETCPSSILQLDGASGRYEDVRDAADTTYVGPSFTSQASYDLPSGTLALSVTPVDGQMVEVYGADTYTLVGPPAGTVVPVRVVLEFDGTIETRSCDAPGCGAHLRASVFDEFLIATTRVDAPPTPGNTTTLDTATLSLSMVAGTPHTIRFGLLMSLAAGGTHAGVWTGRLRFEDLPTGAGILSCRGFAMAPTVVEPSTWGRLKALYR